MEIIFTPNAKYILQIREWLKRELVKKTNQFYYNFIHADLDSDNFACYIDNNDEAQGFIIYTFSGKHASIDIAVVKCEEQRKGIGKFLLGTLERRLSKKGTLVLSLMCEPSNSERKWKKLGFKNFKEIGTHRSLNIKNLGHPWLFKPLVPTKKSTRRSSSEDYIELWTEQEHTVISSNLGCTYSWDVTNLVTPIIYPVDGDWLICYVKENKIVYKGKVKRFNYSFSDYGNFLILERLMY